jgi:hypothetical protein
MARARDPGPLMRVRAGRTFQPSGPCIGPTASIPVESGSLQPDETARGEPDALDAPPNRPPENLAWP